MGRANGEAQRQPSIANRWPVGSRLHRMAMVTGDDDGNDDCALRCENIYCVVNGRSLLYT